MSLVPRIKRISGGWAFVYDIRDADGSPMRVLRIGGAFQSGTYYGNRRFEAPFEYMRSFDRIFDAEALGIEKVLVIGGGGCAYPKHLVVSREDVSVDVVELDSRVIEIARKYFFVRELEDDPKCGSRFRLIADDGVSFLERTTKVYDVIVNDAFEGSDAVGAMFDSKTLGIVKNRLSNGGLYVSNIVVDDTVESAERLNRILSALNASFENLYICFATDEALSDRDNYIAIATDAEYEFQGAMRFDESL